MKPNRSPFPLTRFLGMLMVYTDQQLRDADPEKAARRYGINPEHARGYIEMDRSARGLVQ